MIEISQAGQGSACMLTVLEERTRVLCSTSVKFGLMIRDGGREIDTKETVQVFEVAVSLRCPIDVQLTAVGQQSCNRPSNEVGLPQPLLLPSASAKQSSAASCVMLRREPRDSFAGSHGRVAAHAGPMGCFFPDPGLSRAAASSQRRECNLTLLSRRTGYPKGC